MGFLALSNMALSLEAQFDILPDNVVNVDGVDLEVSE